MKKKTKNKRLFIVCSKVICNDISNIIFGINVLNNCIEHKLGCKILYN